MSRAILIAGHGSRMMFNKTTIEMQADALRRMGHEHVYIGFNESSQPSIENAMQAMADDGIEEVVVLPFFIASGLHMTRDIPPKLGLAAGETSAEVEVGGRRMRVHFEKPLGEDPNLTDILHDRIAELAEGDGRTGVMVIGHGSRLAYNREITELNAARLRERGHEHVYVGFNEFDEPRIAETTRRMVGDGIEEIIVLPLFIASGAHLSSDVPAALGIPERCEAAVVEHDGGRAVVRYAQPVGADPRLSRVLDAKVSKYYRGG